MYVLTGSTFVAERLATIGWPNCRWIANRTTPRSPESSRPMQVRCWHSRSGNRSRRVPWVPEGRRAESQRICSAAGGELCRSDDASETCRRTRAERQDRLEQSRPAAQRLRDIEPAIEAFRKQIEINPYDQYVYDNLGHAYVEQQKFAEAEAAFQKQLEVNPLDQYAPASLGSLPPNVGSTSRPCHSFRKRSRCGRTTPGCTCSSERRTEPEARIGGDRRLRPGDGTVAHADDVERHRQRFALNGVHLDRALHYAESAVSSATAASRNLDIMRADERLSPSCGHSRAYWDTLGWVYFARGDAARAERLVEAAWLLDQHAEVGDHLAQIYQKLGRSEDAIRTYALAVAAERPSDEIRQRFVDIAGERKTESLVETHRPELTKSRTVAIPGTGPSGKSADFLVLFSSPAVVENVRFVGGDEALRPLGDVIRKAAFKRMFPDEQQAKILRRGVLACGAASCDFTLLLPGDTRPVK